MDIQLLEELLPEFVTSLKASLTEKYDEATVEVCPYQGIKNTWIVTCVADLTTEYYLVWVDSTIGEARWSFLSQR
jgi:hypothetical protein